jgi:hypothetical protein
MSSFVDLLMDSSSSTIEIRPLATFNSPYSKPIACESKNLLGVGGLHVAESGIPVMLSFTKQLLKGF